MSNDDQLHRLMRSAAHNVKSREDGVKAAGKRALEADLHVELSQELYDALHITVMTGESATFRLREHQWTIWRGGHRWPVSPGWSIEIPDYAHEMRIGVGELGERLLAEIARWEERTGPTSST
jgi:hypothetical protein